MLYLELPHAPGKLAGAVLKAYGAKCAYCSHEQEIGHSWMTQKLAVEILRNHGWRKLKHVGWVCCNRKDLVDND